MKKHPILIVVALTTTLLCGSVLCTCVNADNSDDKLFGNGRFLRRLRDDVAGRSKPDPKKKEAAKSPTKVDPRSRGAKREPTPAARPSAAVPSRNRRSAVLNNPSKQTSPSTSESKSKQDTGKDAKKTPTGFGMKIESKNEKLIVTKTESRGNAAEAGVRKGDVIVAAGGVEIGSIEELDEITKILGSGDQLEFEIARRGQKKTVLVQFGEAPQESEVVVPRDETPAKKVSNYNFLPAPAAPAAPSPRGLRSVLNDPQPDSGKPSPESINRIPKPESQSTVQPRPGLSDSQAIIEQQRLQIEQMQREINRLRLNTELNFNDQGTIQKPPSLSGPQK